MANVKWYGNHVFTLATEANIKAMKTAAILVQDDVKTHFTLQGDYKPSPRGKKTHWSSRPGEPPALDTGILRASIMHEVKQHGLSIDGRVGPDVEHIAAKAPVGTNVEYGYFMEMGTKPHTIRVKNAKVLTDGKRFFGTEVEHPGTAPRPFLRPAIKRTRKKVVKIFKEANS